MKNTKEFDYDYINFNCHDNEFCMSRRLAKLINIETGKVRQEMIENNRKKEVADCCRFHGQDL